MSQPRVPIRWWSHSNLVYAEIARLFDLRGSAAAANLQLITLVHENSGYTPNRHSSILVPKLLSTVFGTSFFGQVYQTLGYSALCMAN